MLKEQEEAELKRKQEEERAALDAKEKAEHDERVRLEAIKKAQEEEAAR